MFRFPKRNCAQEGSYPESFRGCSPRRALSDERAASVTARMEQHREEDEITCPERLLSFPLSGYQISGLLNYFFKLRAEHSSVVAIKRDMEPIPFLALDNEF